MRSSWRTLLPYVFLIFAGTAAGTERGAGNPHELPRAVAADRPPPALCTGCHRLSPPPLSSDATRDVVPDMRAYVADGVSMCLACHEPDVVNHPLGARPEFPVPADLPLDPAGKISCLTCHYTHGPLTGIRPRSSVSLLERLFERDRLHKTFLLRRENGRGQLCMACHDS